MTFVRALLFLAVVAAAALVGLGCGDEPAETASTTPPVTSAPAPALTTQTTSDSPLTTMAVTEATDPDPYVMTTSAESWAFSQAAMTEALRLGDAIIYYLDGRVDLATVQNLVAPSAQEDLAEMLRLLKTPTDCVVNCTAYRGGSNVVEVEVWFADSLSEYPDFTLTVVIDPDEATITAIAHSAPSASFDTRVQYLSPFYSFYHTEAVVLGTVVEALPLGYVIEVEKAFGPSSIPGQITVYALRNATTVLDDGTQKVQEDFPLDANPGDRLLVPLVKISYFGTPDLEPDEYWVQSNVAVYEVHEDGL
ncbi:MAG: hypothetical protein JW990_12025, partial [Thermoleophilia bacterium]|nr:hypothetical protein [Thermoleophilia bacterium]